jgi:hypothetical protein
MEGQTVVTVTMDENGINLKVENATSPEQVIYMLAQAQITIVTPEDEENEDVQELSATNAPEEESDVSKLQ